jgi:hypothetical protein
VPIEEYSNKYHNIIMKRYEVGHIGDEADDEALLPIVRALQSEVQARLVGDKDEAGVIDVDVAWDRAMRSVAEPMIIDGLRKLDAPELLKLYVSYVGEDEFSERLKQLVQAKLLEREYDLRIKAIEYETRTAGILRFDHFAPNEIIRVALFKPTNIRDAYKGSSIPAARSITARLLQPPNGVAEILNDVSPTSLRAVESALVLPHGRMLIGHVSMSDQSEQIEPFISVHTPLSYGVGNEIMSTAEIVGYVESADSQILMNGYR